MKHIVDILSKANIITKKLALINNKSLGIRKKIIMYEGVDTQASYLYVAEILQKSRFVRKNVLEIEEILHQVKAKFGHNFKIKIIIIRSPLCSHAKQALKDNGWSIHLDTI